MDELKNELSIQLLRYLCSTGIDTKNYDIKCEDELYLSFNDVRVELNLGNFIPMEVSDNTYRWMNYFCSQVNRFIELNNIMDKYNDKDEINLLMTLNRYIYNSEFKEIAYRNCIVKKISPLMFDDMNTYHLLFSNKEALKRFMDSELYHIVKDIELLE